MIIKDWFLNNKNNGETSSPNKMHYISCWDTGHPYIFKDFRNARELKGLNDRCYPMKIDNAYSIFENKFYDNLCALRASFYEITEEQYNKGLKNKICNCPVGEGTNIQIASAPYTKEEALEKIK